LAHFIHFIKNWKETGAVAPSSRFLVNDLVSQLRKDLQSGQSESLKILEIGPGTGVLTKQIVKYLRPNDSLDVVEIHDHFYKLVNRKYSRDNVAVHHADFLKFNPTCKYDYIFSSLPYESIPKEISRKLWEKKLNCCKEEAYISYYKYLNFKKFRCDYEKKIVKKYRCDKKLVLLNLPPAHLFTLEVNLANGVL